MKESSMKTIDLYRIYLAQTAIVNAMDRTDGLVSLSNGFSVSDPRDARWSDEAIERAVARERKLEWLGADELIGFSITSAEIKTFADGWSVRDKALSGKRVAAFRREMPGPTVVLIDSPGHYDPMIHVAGIIHGKTYSINMGRTSEEV